MSLKEQEVIFDQNPSSLAQYFMLQLTLNGIASQYM
jgi:hypothetical protein